jgi:Leucine Rich repeat
MEIHNHPAILALLFEAHSDRLHSLDQVLNKEVGRYVKHLTLKNPSPSNLQLITATCNHCESLNLSNTDITDQDIKNLVENLPYLKSLNLSGCKNITHQGLIHLQTLPSLQSLGLSECTQITDQGLKYLKDLPSLQSLNLFSCKKITNQGIERLKRGRSVIKIIPPQF